MVSQLRGIFATHSTCGFVFRPPGKVVGKEARSESPDWGQLWPERRLQRKLRRTGLETGATARGTMQFKISDFTSQTHGIEVLDDVAAEHAVGIGEDHEVRRSLRSVR